MTSVAWSVLPVTTVVADKLRLTETPRSGDAVAGVTANTVAVPSIRARVATNREGNRSVNRPPFVLTFSVLSYHPSQLPSVHDDAALITLGADVRFGRRRRPWSETFIQCGKIVVVVAEFDRSRHAGQQERDERRIDADRHLVRRSSSSAKSWM